MLRLVEASVLTTDAARVAFLHRLVALHHLLMHNEAILAVEQVEPHQYLPRASKAPSLGKKHLI